MRISAWAAVIAVGFAGSILAGGCVVGDGDDDNNTDGGAGVGGGGTGGSGGSSGTGGSSGRGGSSGSAGASGSAGQDSGPPLNCNPVSTDNTCIACMKMNCCTELLACGNDDACSGSGGMGELTCIQNCVFAATADGGRVVDDALLATCAGQCAEGSTISEATNDAVACMNDGTRADGGMGEDDCFVDCLSGD